MTFGFRLDLKDSGAQISKGIMNAVLPDIKKDFKNATSKIKGELPGLVNDIVVSSPEYASLIGGELKFELGIPDAATKIAELINLWTQNIKYSEKTPSVKNFGISGSFSASLFKVDFSEVIGSSHAQVYDNIRGYNLPWLKWLVFDGNIPIIQDFSVEMINSPRSRTGGALMTSGGSWGVPASFAGTIADNWITRAIESKSSEIDKLLDKAFK